MSVLKRVSAKEKKWLCFMFTKYDSLCVVNKIMMPKITCNNNTNHRLIKAFDIVLYKSVNY